MIIIMIIIMMMMIIIIILLFYESEQNAIFMLAGHVCANTRVDRQYLKLWKRVLLLSDHVQFYQYASGFPVIKATTKSMA